MLFGAHTVGRMTRLATTKAFSIQAPVTHQLRYVHHGKTPKRPKPMKTLTIGLRGKADVAQSRRSDRKVAIVTGASSGIGEALSRDLVKQGWQVAMVDINTNEKLLQELGDNASFHKTDVSSYSEQSKTFQDVWDQYGRIDALLANAGVVDKGSIYILNHRGSDELPPKPNLGCTDVNFKGLVYGTQLAIHFMRKNETPEGSIIATSSNAAVIPHEAAPEYCGAKAGMVGFVRGASRVLKIKDNIRINAVLPGVIRTPLLPAGAIAAVPPECITQLSTVVSAFSKLLDDESLNGEALECSAEDVVPLVYGKSTMSPVPVWDPLFKMMHHENSGLPEAVA